mmetsp:Transcript_17716/g.38276  ORF Transcript_17716/g.38276 Transcript_17716/m.38276 type:complete len:445 (-) Transcript_17716:537-1871(-)
MDPPGTAIDDPTDGNALDLEEVKRLAAEEDYELVYFSKESRLISFQPTEGDADSDGGDNENSNDVRINIYWTTGTIGTCFDHPTRGKTQFFRRVVGLRALGDIFRNPRVVHTDTDGYYETQENVPEVPLDDRNHIDLLQETNQMLREQLNDSQTIEITGPRGDPVYAMGSFRDGRWMLKRGGLWGVDLAMASSNDDDETGSMAHMNKRASLAGLWGSEAVVPISSMNSIEVRLGGILYASASSHEVHAQMEEQDWDGNMQKEVLCHFGGPVTGVWLPIRINGWPQSHYSKVQSKDFSRRRNNYRDNLDVYEVLLEEVTDLYPEATISFHRLSFFGECVEQMVNNLGLAPQSEKRQEEEELWNIANLIATELRCAGNDDIGEAFIKRVNDLQMAAYMKLTINNETRDTVEADIPTLVQMQLDSQSSAEFLSQVQWRYNISSLSGN